MAKLEHLDETRQEQRIRQYKVVEHNVMGSPTPQNQDLYGRHNSLVSQRQK